MSKPTTATATSVYDPPDQPEVAELYGDEAAQQWRLAVLLQTEEDWQTTVPAGLDVVL